MSEQLDLFDVGPRDRQQTVPIQRTCTPWPIGSGPAGESCGSCRHAVPTHSGSGKRFYKCALVRAYWTRGDGSDIKLRWSACRSWQAKPSDPEGAA